MALAEHAQPEQRQPDPAAREALARAAAEVVREHGVAAASVREIARRAGVTTGGIYWHFGSKEELILAALERVGLEAFGPGGVVVEGDTLAAALAGIADQAIAGWTADPDALRLSHELFEQAHHSPALAARMVELLHEELEAAGNDLAAAAHKVGESLPLEPREFALAVTMTLFGLGQARRLFGEELVPDRLLREVIRLLAGSGGAQ